MFKNFSIVPRWVIFLIDIGASLFCYLLAIAIRQNLTLISVDWAIVINSLGLILIINTLVFNAIKTYSGIVRYTGLQDAVRIAISILASSVMLFLINTISTAAKSQFILSTSILIVYSSFSFLLLIPWYLLPLKPIPVL